MQRPFSFREIFVAILFLCAFSCSSGSTPQQWVKARVGNTKIILNAPGTFIPNNTLKSINNDKKFSAYVLEASPNAYSLSEHFNDESDYKLDESAEQFMTRLKSKFPKSVSYNRTQFNIQGSRALRLDGIIAAEGSESIFFVWLGFYKDDYAWVFEAHYPQGSEPKQQVERVISSIEITPDNKTTLPSSSTVHDWNRVKVGDTHLSVLTPSAFVSDPRFQNVRKEGMQKVVSYYSNYAPTDNAFVISESYKEKGYSDSLKTNAEQVFNHLKSKASSCSLSSRHLTSIAGKEGNISTGTLTMNNVSYGFIYCIFRDKNFIWLAQVFYENAGPSSGRSYESAQKFINSVQIAP